MTHTLHPQVISDMAALFAKARRRMDRETPGWNVALGAMEASELETIARQEEDARARVAAALAAQGAGFPGEGGREADGPSGGADLEGA